MTQAEIDNLTSQRDDALARIAAFDAKYAALQTQLQAQITDLQAQVVALGGTTLAKQMQHDKAVADAQQAVVTAQANLATLTTMLGGK